MKGGCRFRKSTQYSEFFNISGLMLLPSPAYTTRCTFPVWKHNQSRHIDAFFLIRESSLTKIPKKCKMLKDLFSSLLREELVCWMEGSSEIKLEMMSHHPQHACCTYCFNQRHQTGTRLSCKNRRVKLFYNI